MSLMIIEYSVLVIILVTLYSIGVKQSNKRKFLTVKNLRHECKTELEKMLYDQLTRNQIYVSPNVRLGYSSIPLALEPYKMVILLYPKSRKALVSLFVLKHKEFYLKSTGWNVMKISEEIVQSNPALAIQTIISHDKVKKI